jgi:hypothetical protein
MASGRVVPVAQLQKKLNMQTISKENKFAALTLDAESPKVPEEKRDLPGILLRLLDHRHGSVAICAFFVAALALWFALDQSIPGYDSTFHAIYSSSVKRFLTHYKSWSFENFVALLQQHFGYPAGSWFFNGFLKTIFGDSIWGDHACMLVQLAVLGLGFQKLSSAIWNDRAKANAGLIILFCTPLVCAMAHLPLLDLLHTAAFAGFFAALLGWYQNKNWKSATIAGLLFGFFCVTKQIAVLYSVPTLGLLFLAELWKRNWRSVGQIVYLGSMGPLFLLSWFLPNFTAIKTYLSSRGAIGATADAKIAMIVHNFALSSGQMVESFGPLLLCLTPFLVSSVVMRKNAIANRILLIPSIAAVLGWVLLMTIFYYNAPEPRYYGPVVVVFAALVGALTVEALKSGTRWRQMVGVSALALSVVQMLALNFSCAPTIKYPKPLKSCPVYDIFGIKEGFLKAHLGCDLNGNAWKQKWIFDTIEGVEKIRYVTLNVLPSTWEFNQGSMCYLSHVRKSHVLPITWRKCNPDMSDNFTDTPQSAANVDWFLVKTGAQGAHIRPAENQKKFDAVVKHVEESGEFQLMKAAPLPDGTELRLYRKDYVKQWLRQAAELRAKKAANLKSAKTRI